MSATTNLGYYLSDDDGQLTDDVMCRHCYLTLGAPDTPGVGPYVPAGCWACGETDRRRIQRVAGGVPTWQCDACGATLRSEAMFADREEDTPTHCNRCDQLIPHSLTSQGYDYVAEQIAYAYDQIASGASGPSAAVAAWIDQYGDVIYDRAIADARQEGAERGHSAAEWWAQDAIGGRATRREDATATAVLAGINDGDPEVPDGLPWCDLSGEWAGSAQARDVIEDVGMSPADPAASDILDAYSDAHDEAMADEVVASARRHLER